MWDMELNIRGEIIYNRLDEQGIKDIIDANLRKYGLEELKELAKIESDKTVSLIKALSTFGDSQLEFPENVFWEPMTLPQCMGCEYWSHDMFARCTDPCDCGAKIRKMCPINNRTMIKARRMSQHLDHNIETGTIDWKEFHRMSLD
jgi:hypothetical protein